MCFNDFKHFREFVQIDHLSNLFYFVITKKQPKNQLHFFLEIIYNGIQKSGATLEILILN